MKDKIGHGRQTWGPIIWNMYHTFSINFVDLNESNELYKYFINCLGYILPCETCKIHYNYIVNDIFPVDNSDICKDNFFKYTYEIHKLINETLSKKNISYKEAYKIHKVPNNKDILFIMKTIYINLDYHKMSFFLYDKVYNFFIAFCKLYPDKNIRKNLINMIESTNFKNILTINEFQKFIKNIFINI